MIESNYFHREAVRSRMLDHAAKEWGYDNSELENFDPLVSLLMGGLAKEIEKTYQTFDESYSRVVNHIIETLIPGNKLDFLPAHNIIHLENMNEMSIVDKSGITLKHTITIDKEDKEIEFVPILPSETLPLQVKYIADGHGIYSMTGIDRFEDYRYSVKDNSIYIGIDSNLTKHYSLVDLDLYVDWLNFPDKKKMVEIGHMVKWFKGGTELKQQTKSSFEFINKISQDEFLV